MYCRMYVLSYVFSYCHIVSHSTLELHRVCAAWATLRFPFLSSFLPFLFSLSETSLSFLLSLPSPFFSFLLFLIPPLLILPLCLIHKSCNEITSGSIVNTSITQVSRSYGRFFLIYRDLSVLDNWWSLHTYSTQHVWTQWFLHYININLRVLDKDKIKVDGRLWRHVLP